MARIMTTQELSCYLKLCDISIYTYAAYGLIPAIRIPPVYGDLIRM